MESCWQEVWERGGEVRLPQRTRNGEVFGAHVNAELPPRPEKTSVTRQTTGPSVDLRQPPSRGLVAATVEVMGGLGTRTAPSTWLSAEGLSRNSRDDTDAPMRSGQCGTTPGPQVRRLLPGGKAPGGFLEQTPRAWSHVPAPTGLQMHQLCPMGRLTHRHRPDSKGARSPGSGGRRLTDAWASRGPRHPEAAGPTGQ